MFLREVPVRRFATAVAVGIAVGLSVAPPIHPDAPPIHADARPSDGGRVAAHRAACGRSWSAPVEVAVRDPFRPPEDPYGPGNLGLEYATVGGELVRAVDGGVVRFAGPVGGNPVVVVDHGGLVSTYTSLTTRSLDRGQAVDRGQTVGVAANGLHLTARIGGRYLDPALLLDGRCGTARLTVVPARS